jgi:hypothetical protein
MELKIPVLALVDSDPYGLKILSVYMKGSMNMSYDSSNLTTPDIKWLGVRPSDLDRFNIPEQCRLPMTEEDIKTGKKLVWCPWQPGGCHPAHQPATSLPLQHCHQQLLSVEQVGWCIVQCWVVSSAWCISWGACGALTRALGRPALAPECTLSLFHP